MEKPLEEDKFCLEFSKNDVKMYSETDARLLESSPYEIRKIDKESQSITLGFVEPNEGKKIKNMDHNQEVYDKNGEFSIVSRDTMKQIFQSGIVYYARNKVIIKDRNENKKESVSTACFCADYFNGANSYGQSSSQKQKCNRMYICLANAMKDCIGGTSNVWSRSDCY